MKQNNDPLITRSILESTLDERFEKFGREQNEKMREYRDDVLNKLDELLGGELSQIREDQVFMDADVKSLKKRVTKLERSSKVL